MIQTLPGGSLGGSIAAMASKLCDLMMVVLG